MASRLSNGQIRSIFTSVHLCGKRNFRKFNLYEKRPSRHFWRVSRNSVDKELKQYFNRGTRPIGIEDEAGKLKVIPEMIPELIVPNLEGFELKPYVSYRVPDIVQTEFKPQDLFYAIYSKKIAEDFKNNKLNEDGSPKHPTEEEALEAEKAKQRAISCGSDIYGK